MKELNQVYKCFNCGNIVELVHSGEGALTCCDKPMFLMKENSQDSTTEKHVPLIEKTENGYSVKVGSTKHPMDEEHYIEWIELITTTKVYRKHLNPGDEPEASFVTDEEIVKAREYCNLHGLWKDS